MLYGVQYVYIIYIDIRLIHKYITAIHCNSVGSCILRVVYIYKSISSFVIVIDRHFYLLWLLKATHF